MEGGKVTLTANAKGQMIIARETGKRVKACNCVYGMPEIHGYHGADQRTCREKCGPTHCLHIDDPSHVHLIDRDATA